MSRAVRQVDPWTIGGGGRLRELFPLPAPLILLGRSLAWLIRHPIIVGTAVALAALRAQLGSWWLPSVLVIGFWAALAAVYVLWAIRPTEGGASLSPADVWRGRRRRKTLTTRWANICETNGLGERAAHGIPSLFGWQITPLGITVEAGLGSVYRSVEDLAKKSTDVADAMHCRTVEITRARPGVARMDLRWGDPLNRTVRLDDIPPPPAGRISFGLRENGAASTVSLSTSLLVGGVTGSGKSDTLWAMLAGLITAGVPVRLRVVDPAGGVELHELGRHLDEDGEGVPFKVHRYVDREAKVKELVAEMHKAMECRLGQMQKKNQRLHKPTLAEPLDILVIDELLSLSSLLRNGGEKQFREIAFLGRKAGYIIWGFTQLGQIDAIGRIRDLIPQRICLATTNREVTDAVLGDGAESQGARCSIIPKSLPGIGYQMSDEDRGYRRFRAAWVPDSETRRIARGQLSNATRMEREQEMGEV